MTEKKRIRTKNSQEIEILLRAGQILAGIVKEVTCSLKSGMTTLRVDEMAEQLIAARAVLPAFKGYRGYPCCTCISINQEVVHGIPGSKIIRDGDLVSLDLGIIHEGYYSDMAITVGVGKLSPDRERLLEVGPEALRLGIAQARAGNHLSDISFAIQSYVEANGYSVVRDYVGHGIGTRLHEEPEIPNFGTPHQGPLLQVGMVFAIEPMVNMGSWQTKILDDGWTVETVDGKPSVHFEHTIAITENGPRILTL